MKVHNSVFAEQTDDNISSVYKAQVVAYIGGSEIGHDKNNKCIIQLP